MFGSALEGGGEGEGFVFRCAGDGVDSGDFGLAFGQGAGFVEDEGIDAGQAFEAFAPFEKDAELRAASDSDGQRGWHGEAHGAGAGNDEDGDGYSEGAA